MEKAPEDCPALLAFGTGEPVLQEHPITGPDNTTRYCSFACSPIKNAEGSVVNVLELVQDVSSRHAMEKDLKTKNEELERLNRLFVNREFRIKELRDRVAELENQVAKLKR